MMSAQPPGWREPINEGLAAPNTWGGIPTAFACLGIIPSVGVAFLLRAWLMLPGIAFVYAVAAALTRWDPHWPGVLWDFLFTPHRIEP